MPPWPKWAMGPHSSNQCLSPRDKEEKQKKTSSLSLNSFSKNKIYVYISFVRTFFGWSYSAARETEKCLLAKFVPTLNKIVVML